MKIVIVLSPIEKHFVVKDKSHEELCRDNVINIQRYACVRKTKPKTKMKIALF